MELRRVFPRRNLVSETCSYLFSEKGVCRRTALPWGFGPFDVPNVGSDLHRAYLTRLCCASKLSQPLDAFIPPTFFRPCFVPEPSMGFLLSEVSPSREPPRISPRSTPLAVRPCAYMARLQGLMPSRGPFATKVVLPSSVGRASPSLLPFRGLDLRASASYLYEASSHGLFSNAGRVHR